MASHRDPPPFRLGDTLAGTDADGNLINTEVLGKVYSFPCYSSVPTGPKQPAQKRTEGALYVVALRNTSGVTLYGKRLAALDTSTGGKAGLTAVTGYSNTLAQANVVFIDEFIATTGVAANDIFWGVIKGPVIVSTSAVGTDFNGDIAIGAPLVAATSGATTASTTAGRISNVTLWAGATTAAQATQNHSMATNIVAVAMSAKTTANTNADILVNACISRIWH